ncbi:DedD protein [Methylohalomonas lacus]|uniref:DedD protein n=1 Tax=Methylohalomonas lacus TaxID=398773 RepID=A0AAE3L5Q8_9GAMM|nr:SPOR domain-containing protein [Methylohalomonas lacus]MCS3903747.1 DedD protein [Methylohalomonas lacus]
MDRGLKERLVGAAVLVALAVIFIPMLLDDAPPGPGPISESNIPPQPEETGELESRIKPLESEAVTVEPPPPQAEDIVTEPAGPTTDAEPEPSVPLPDDESDAEAAAAEPADEPAGETPASEPESDSGADAVSAEESADSDGPSQSAGQASADRPEGWVVQLGSFSRQSNAEQLNEKLKKAGYDAFVEPVRQSGQQVYRVRVGPEVQRSEAEKVRDAISDEFDLKGIVVSYP